MTFLRPLRLVVPFVLVSISGCTAPGLRSGWQAYESGFYATALHEWEPLANAGDAPSQFLLGTMYDEGKGVPRDAALAAQWYRRAADQGYALAQNNLGY